MSESANPSIVSAADDAAPLSPAQVKQLKVTRSLRWAAFVSVLALPVVVGVLAVVNRLTDGGTAFLASGAPWTQTFWSALFYLMMAGVLLALVTVTRRCPRCQNGFFVSKGYGRDRSSVKSRGTVNVFAGRCVNCRLPLKSSV